MFAGGSALSKLARRGRGNILRLPQQQPQQQCCCRRMIHIEKRIQDLGLVLPPPSQPKANYNICCFVTKDNMLYVSGHLPTQIDGTLVTGKIGTAEEGGKPVEHGYDAARTAGLALLATVQEQLGGDLDRVEQVVKVFGMVQSADSFKEQHLVMNGCSDLLMEVFGKPTGYHARSAIGVNTLPLDVSVEVEAIIQFKS